MIRVDTSPAPPHGGARPAAEARVRDVAQQLESVFVQRLFAAMRETVSHDGVVDGGAGEELFTGMLDERMAAAVPAQWEHGIGEALVRQLQRALERQAPSDAPVEKP